MSKRFYWLKLKQDFFDRRVIKKLRRLPKGDTFVIIYLKLLLLSLNDEGRLISEGIEDELAEELALDLYESEDDVRFTLRYFIDCGLAEIQETDLLLAEVNDCTGSESDSAARMRKKRLKDKEKSHGDTTVSLSDNSESHGSDNVTLEIRDREEKEKKSSLSTHPQFKVPMNQTRYSNLCIQYGESTVDSYFQKIIDYSDSTGRKYKDFAATAGIWISKDNVPELSQSAEIPVEEIPDFIKESDR